jgi:hypothetical protein
VTILARKLWTREAAETPVEGTRAAVDIPVEAATPAEAIPVAVVLIPVVEAIQGEATQGVPEVLIPAEVILAGATLVEDPTMAAGTPPTTREFRN